MITVTVNEILDSVEFFKKLGNMPLQAKVAFKVTRMMKAIDEEIANFGSAKQQVLKRYADLNERGELILNEKSEANVKEENREKYRAEMIELLKTEINLQIDPIELDELGDIDFTPNELMDIEKFIKI